MGDTKPEKGRKRKWPRRMLGLLLLFTAATTALFLAVQLPWSKARLLTYAVRSASELSGLRIESEGLSGVLPFDTSLRTLRVSDDGGECIVVTELRVLLRGSALLRGSVHLESVSAAQITLDRLPELPEKPAEPPSLPQIPRIPGWLRLEHVAFPEIRVGEAVLGESAVFEASANFVGIEQATVHVARTDAAESTRLDFTLGTDAEGELALSLDLFDATFFPTLTQTKDPLVASLEPARDRSGAAYTLRFTQGGVELLAAELLVALGPPHSLTMAGRFDLSRLTVPKGVAERFGTTGDIALSAALHDDTSLDLRNLELRLPLASLTANGTYHPGDGRIALEIAADFDDFDQVAGTSLSETPLPLRIEATLDGLGAQSKATLAAIVAGDEQARLGIEMLGSSPARVQIAGVLTPKPPFVSAEVAALLEEGVDLAARVAYGAGGEIAIDSFALDSPKGQLSLEGTASTVSKTLDLLLAGQMGDLAPLGAVYGQEVTGGGEFKATLRSDGINATAESLFNLQDVLGAGVSAQRVTLRSTLDFQDWTAAPLAGMTANAHLEAEGVATQEQLFERILADAELHSEDGETFHLNRLEVVLPLVEDQEELRVSSTGAYVLADGSFTASGEILVNDLETTLGRFQSPDAPVIAGSVLIHVVQVARTPEGDLFLHLEPQGAEVRGLPAPLDTLLGPSPKLTVAVDVKAGIAVTRTLLLEGAALRADAHATYDLVPRQLEARLDTNTLALGPLFAAMDEVGDGRASLAARLEGTLDSLALDATLKFSDLSLRSKAYGDGEARIVATGLPRLPEGLVEISAGPQGEKLGATAGFSWREGVLEVRSFESTLSELNLIAGNFVFVAGEGLTRTDVQLTLRDLAAVGRVLGMPLTGSITGTVSTTEGRGLQIAAAVEEVAGPGFTFARGRVDGQILDPAGKLGLSIIAEGEGLVAGQMELGEFQVSLTGDMVSIAFDALTSGTLRDAQPFRAEWSGTASLDERWLRLERLEATAGRFPIMLTGPFDIRQTKGTLEVQEAILKTDTGELRFGGGYSGENLSAQVAWENLPLGIVALFADLEISGRSGGEIVLSGSPSAPKLAGNLLLTRMRATSEAGRRAPPIEIVLDVTVETGAARMELKAAMPEAIDLVMVASLPVRLAIAPWDVGLVPDGALEGELKGDIQLSAIPLLLGMEAHLIEGRLVSAYRVGGTVAAVRADGASRLEGGRYENSVTSTVFEDIEAVVEAAGEKLDFRVDARAGRSGSVAIRGEALLRPSEDFPFAGTVRLAEARLAHRDDLNVVAQGTLELAGTRKGANVTGDIVLGPATLFIPEELPPPAVTALEIEEINVPAERLVASAPRKAPYPLSLDLRCALPGRVFIRGRGLFSEWQGDLEVKGNAYAPRILGELSVLRGDLQFLGREFNLAESTITFNGQSPPSPNLDLRGVARTRDVNAIVRLRGTPSDTELLLSSDPPLPRDEVLSYILFGTGLSEITPVQALQVAQAAATLARGRRSFAESAKLPVDRISLHKGDTPGETTIGIGRYISDTVYMELQQGLGRTSGKATVRVDINNSLKVEADAGADADAGIGIYWRKNY